MMKRSEECLAVAGWNECYGVDVVDVLAAKKQSNLEWRSCSVVSLFRND
ncbi:hypothetical protein AB4139_10970 [Vibrio cyclitrophicus]